MKLNKIQIPRRVFIALILTCVFVFGQSMPMYAAERTAVSPSAAAEDTLSREQAVGLVFAAARKYREDLKLTDIMSGYPNGSMLESNIVTRAEALVMISRAFGELPEPAGDFLRTSAKPSYAGVPSWAAPYINHLTDKRVMFVVDEEDENGDFSTPDSIKLNGGAPMPASELDYVLRSIYSLCGLRPQDDFYAAVNKEWLATAKIPDDAIMDSYFDRLKKSTEKQTSDIFDDVLSGKTGQDKTARAIRDYYQAALDINAQTSAGAAPIKPYLEKIMTAKDKKELEDALILVSKELAVNVFFDLELRPDEYDKTKYGIYLRTPSLIGTERDPGDADTKEALKRTTALFTLSGIDKGAEYAASVLKTENEGVKIAEKIAAAQDAQASDNTEENESDVNLMFFTKQGRHTEKEIFDLFPDVDFKRVLAACGLKSEPFWYNDYGDTSVKTWAEYYKQADISDLKIYAAYKFLSDCSSLLGDDFLKLDMYYDKDDYKYNAMSSLQQLARPYVEKLYIDKYFSADSKKDVENMAKAFINNYRGRIQNIAWMSASTKATAIKKLDNMVLKVGYPDKLFDPISVADIRSSKDGGSLFSNTTAIWIATRDNMSQKQGKPVDRTEWNDTVTEVNAFYRPTDNEILIPAGILQPPFYTPGAKQEQNMAAIGWVIGHEITHAFDNAGAKFDEYGNQADWWAEADYAKFRELCKAVMVYYNGYEIAPGILADGETTLGENIADLGGISCALEAVSALPDPDYKLFFESAARLWICTMERETLHMQVARDPHSPSKARVNCVLPTFKEFRDTFNVKEGDGMYVAPEESVKVW